MQPLRDIYLKSTDPTRMKSGIALRCAERRLIAVFLARELAHNAHRKGRSGSGGGHRETATSLG